MGWVSVRDMGAIDVQVEMQGCGLGEDVSEVAYNDTRGHGQFKATRPESLKEKKKKGVSLLP